jgi:hypothetical protein
MISAILQWGHLRAALCGIVTLVSSVAPSAVASHIPVRNLIVEDEGPQEMWGPRANFALFSWVIADHACYWVDPFLASEFTADHLP